MSTPSRRIVIFQNHAGKEPFVEWVRSLSRSYRARVFARLDRLETGNWGDYRSVGEGVFELRLHFGAGYRIYFGKVTDTLILLLAGGEKSSQTKDIKRAKAYWKHHQIGI